MVMFRTGRMGLVLVSLRCSSERRIRVPIWSSVRQLQAREGKMWDKDQKLRVEGKALARDGGGGMLGVLEGARGLMEFSCMHTYIEGGDENTDWMVPSTRNATSTTWDANRPRQRTRLSARSTAIFGVIGSWSGSA